MEKHIKTLLSAMMAGALIAIAGTTYLYLKADHTIIGAFLFAFGLLCVVTLDYKLYTGRIGYIIDKDKSYIIEILWIILGNLLGSILIASIIYLANYEGIIQTAKTLVETKLSRNIFEIFGLSIMCGMMMYLVFPIRYLVFGLLALIALYTTLATTSGSEPTLPDK